MLHIVHCYKVLVALITILSNLVELIHIVAQQITISMLISDMLDGGNYIPILRIQD